MSEGIVQGALNRYPQTEAIWAANDPMAIEAVEAIINAGKNPGKDIFVAGLNWDAPALKRVKNGEMVASVGGHFITGGWVLVLLHDYHYGKGFVQETAQLKLEIFSILNRNNIDNYLKHFGNSHWSHIDFSKFSKVLNPTVMKYNFNFDEILLQLKPNFELE